jgi:hypothetical protein
LNDDGQQQMAGAWPELRAAQHQLAGAWPAWPELGAAQQEAPEEPDIVDDVDDQPQVTYRLVQF